MGWGRLSLNFSPKGTQRKPSLVTGGMKAWSEALEMFLAPRSPLATVSLQQSDYNQETQEGPSQAPASQGDAPRSQEVRGPGR